MFVSVTLPLTQPQVTWFRQAEEGCKWMFVSVTLPLTQPQVTWFRQAEEGCK